MCNTIPPKGSIYSDYTPEQHAQISKSASGMGVTGQSGTICSLSESVVHTSQQLE